MIDEIDKPVKLKRIKEEYLVQFLKHVNKLDLSIKTKKAYEQSVTRCITFLFEGKKNTDPTKMTEHEIIYLKEVAMKDLTNRTKQYYITFFGSYLEFYGNNVVKKMHIHWPSDQRVKVDWLEPQDAKTLLEAPINLGQQLAIRLELCSGLRRVEVIRLTIDKVYLDRIDVRGKGRAGGKWRSVPLSADTKEVLDKYLVFRNTIIAEAKARNPDVIVPKEVFIHLNGKELAPYAEHGVGFDKAFVIPVRDATGVHFGNHTLRRTFGRQLWKNGVPIETISKIMGHESTSMTLRYIGVNIGDMSSAINNLSFD